MYESQKCRLQIECPGCEKLQTVEIKLKDARPALRRRFAAGLRWSYLFLFLFVVLGAALHLDLANGVCAAFAGTVAFAKGVGRVDTWVRGAQRNSSGKKQKEVS